MERELVQLYDLRFQTHYPDMADCGRLLVVAGTQDEAVSKALMFLGVPGSATTFQIDKIKPAIFQMDRTEVFKNVYRKETKEAGGFLPKVSYVLNAVLMVKARTETAAWRKAANYLLNKTRNSRFTDNNIESCEINAERQSRTGAELKSPMIERQAIYKETRIFRGGKGDGNAR